VNLLLLFNPRTEHNAYCLLAVALAIYITQAVAARSWLVAVALIGIATAMLASYPLGHFLPTAWLKPLVCVLFLGIVLGGSGGNESAHSVCRLHCTSKLDPAPFGVTAAGRLNHANRTIGVL